MAAGPIQALRGLAGAAGWIAVTRQEIRHELHLSGDRPEVTRHGMLGGGRITLFRNNGNLLGCSSFEISPGGEADFGRQAEEALRRASLGGDPPCPVPGRDTYMQVPLLDSEAARVGQFLPRRARSDIQDGLTAVREVRLAGAEIVLSITRTGVVTSAGAAAENEASTFRVALTLVASRGGRVMERRVAIRRRRYQDLDLKAWTAREAQGALDLLEASPPAAGAVPVLLGPAALGTLTGLLVEATDGERVFRQETPFKVGESILPGRPWPGDPLVFNLNALFPYGMDSYRIDETGVAAQNLRVIDNGVFVNPHADFRHAAWLKLAKASGRPGTPQLKPGPTVEADLRSGDYLEVVRFCEAPPAAPAGRLSAEILLGYEVRGGTRRPVTGGIVSGEIAPALSHTRYSAGPDLRDCYAGPAVALVETGLTVTA